MANVLILYALKARGGIRWRFKKWRYEMGTLVRNGLGEHLRRSAILIMLQSNFIEISLRHDCSPLFLKSPLDGCFWQCNYVYKYVVSDRQNHKKKDTEF